jgi:thiol-disulfide isomerase/thioredoxin
MKAFLRVSPHALVTLLLLAGSALPGALRAQVVGENNVALTVGTQAPQVTIEDLQGKPVALHELIKGKPAVIEFWATWCEQCEALQPEIDRITQRFGDRVQVIAVAVGVAQTVRRVQQHVTEHKITYPVLWDGRGAAVRAFNAATTAIVVIVDAQGKVIYNGVGPSQRLVAEVERALQH